MKETRQSIIAVKSPFIKRGKKKPFLSGTPDMNIEHILAAIIDMGKKKPFLNGNPDRGPAT
jgi:hypothetical protein